MTSILSAAHFHDEAAAYAHIEAHLWPDGRACPHCGVLGRSGALAGRTTRTGLYKCYACRKPFTVKIGTIFENTHLKLHLWLQAIYLLCSCKKGMSAMQLSRVLGITENTAWFLTHRIRTAMRDDAIRTLGLEGNRIVEMDETYYGAKKVKRTFTTRGSPFLKGGHSGPSNKRAVVSMVERGGKVRSFHVQRADKITAHALISRNISTGAVLYTDESRIYLDANRHVTGHETVHHASGEYARGKINTNTIEGFFSIFKRGMKGIYHHCSEKHLHRYLSEFDFRYNSRSNLGYTDLDRAALVLTGGVGKHLSYRELVHGHEKETAESRQRPEPPPEGAVH